MFIKHIKQIVFAFHMRLGPWDLFEEGSCEWLEGEKNHRKEYISISFKTLKNKNSLIIPYNNV